MLEGSSLNQQILVGPMNRTGALCLLPLFLVAVFCATTTRAGFDDANASKIILWSGTDLSSTQVTAAPGDTVQLFAIINNNNGNYGHSGEPNWTPTQGYIIDTIWGPDTIDSATFNWDNNPGYSGENGQGASVSIFNDHLYWLLGNANYGHHNMSSAEVARNNTNGSATWQVISNQGINVGGYHPYAYIYENSVLTSFTFNVKSDIFDSVAWYADLIDGEMMAVYESEVGLGFEAISVYDNNLYDGADRLEGWAVDENHNKITLKIATPLSSLGGGGVAVPEPSTAGLLVLGCLGLMSLSRRRRTTT